MGPNLVLGGACLAPVVLALAVWRMKRAHDRRSGGSRIALLAAGNVGVFLLLMSHLFLGAEVYYRFWYDETDTFGSTLNSQLWWQRHRRLNNCQVRDNIDYSMQRTDQRWRVVFLGDSFAEGHGVRDVDDRFLNRIRAARADRWQVYLLGHNGVDTDTEFLLLRKARLQNLEVDEFVLVYVPNDICSLLPQWYSMDERIATYREGAGVLIQNSFALNAIYFRCVVARDPTLAPYFDMVRDAYFGPAWPQQQQRLRALAEQCQARGEGLSVVLFPFMSGLDDEKYQEIHQKLTEFWQSLGIPTLNLLPLFQAHQGETLVANRYDSHPNERAHELASEAIMKFLDEVHRQRRGAPQPDARVGHE